MNLPPHLIKPASGIKHSLQPLSWEDKIKLLQYMLELAKKKAAEDKS